MIFSLIEEVLKIADENKFKKVEKIVLEIGELTFLSEESLKLTFEILKENYDVLKESSLEIQKATAKLQCENCSFSGNLKLAYDPIYHYYLPTLKCPECGQELKIVEGKECIIKKIFFISQDVNEA